MKKAASLALALGLACLAGAQQSALRVEVGSSTPRDLSLKMDLAARRFAVVASRLTQHAREVRHHTLADGFEIPFSLPTRMVLTQQGQPMLGPVARPMGNPTAISLVFDTQGTARAFPQTYQDQLTATFSAAQATLNIVFGQPTVGGTIHVRNYDADIGDRDAVAGGYYTPDNGSGEQEIRFPVYQSPEATYVNFVHTLLLAYLGPDTYAWDGFQEGLVRAAVLKICRNAGAVPVGLDANQIENVLEATYDVGSFYDWYNQRALGGPVFIAPNLKTTPLPAGGSLGGLYLLRYEMSGTAWFKVLTEYPGFIASLNARLASTPSLGSDYAGLLTAGQQVLDALAGSGGSLIEGHSFADWAKRQFILEPNQTNGVKLLAEPIPISSGLSGTDFGVFLVQANYFSTASDGSESLLSGTCYPIFWDADFNRVFPTAQESQMNIAGAYGSVTPNFPDLYSGQAYRMTVDLPVQDQIARVNLPAGAIATVANPTPNNFFGTVENAPLPLGDTLSVSISWPSSTQSPFPVTNGAFGANISDPTFLDARKVTIQVVQFHNGSPSTLLTRIVDKGIGPLAVDLRVGSEGTFVYSGGLPAGISMVGFPVDPFASNAPDVFGVPANQLLLAKFNQTHAAYDLFPDIEAPTIGHGYFVRLDTAQPSFSVEGRSDLNTPTAVALKPGWNMISSPMMVSVPTASVKVVRSTAVPIDYSLSAGTDIGVDFFRFIQGSNDPTSGVPETGSLIPAISFEPGVAYFVRVLAPEGVSMLFYPANPVAGPFARSFALQNAATSGWQMRVDLLSARRTVSAFIGTSGTATSAFNPKEDSAMPPGIGGFQLTVVDTQPLFRDIRESAMDHTYSLKLAGLQKGATYQLQPNLIRGSVGKYVLTTANGQSVTLPPNKIYQFTATANVQTLKITVRKDGR